MRSAPSRTPTASFDSVIDRVKVATFMGTDRPHVLRQAIHCCRNFGTVSIVGVYGGFLDKIPMGSAINRGLTFRMAQTPVQHYLPKLLERIEKGEIDPSFVITHRANARGRPGALQDVPRQEGRLHQGRHEAVRLMGDVAAKEAESHWLATAQLGLVSSAFSTLGSQLAATQLEGMPQ